MYETRCRSLAASGFSEQHQGFASRYFEVQTINDWRSAVDCETDFAKRDQWFGVIVRKGHLGSSYLFLIGIVYDFTAHDGFQHADGKNFSWLQSADVLLDNR